MKFDYMWRNDVVAHVEVDFSKNKVKVINLTDDLIKRPFGILSEPTISDLEYFLESRCFPKERINCKQLLDDLGLIYYNPLDIVQITHGCQLDDYNWLRFAGEDLEYERDIKLRD